MLCNLSSFLNFFNIFIICEVIPLFGLKKGLFCLMEWSPFLVTSLFVGCTATECRGTWHNVY